MTPRLGLRDVSVRRGGHERLAVDSLDVAAGETLTVVGPNGAGKSTLVQVLALLERPDRGQVLYNGEPVRRSLGERRRMAVVFQEPLLLDTTVEGNAGTGLAVRGVRGQERRRRVADWLERFGIGHLAGRSARTLSGGEAQRASLARALVLEPEVLFLDEPFAALDAPARQALMDDLERLIPAGTATVFVTHDRNEALRLGDRLAVLMGGSIRQIGAPSEVFASPTDEEVAGFVGVETIAAGRVQAVEDGVAVTDVAGRAIEGGERVAPGDDVLVCLRPEDVVLGPVHEGGVPTSARNHLPARVTRIVAAGPYVRVELDAGFPLVALVTHHSVEALGLEAGVETVATFKATAVHLIRRHAG